MPPREQLVEPALCAYRALHCKKAQAQLLEASRDLWNREAVFPHVHQHVATAVEVEEIAEDHRFPGRMIVGEAHDRVAALANALGSRRQVEAGQELSCGP